MGDVVDRYENGDFTEEELKALEKIEDTKYPCVFFRGKPLTHDELITLMLHEEPCLQWWGPNGEDLATHFWEKREYGGSIGSGLQRKNDWGEEDSIVLADGSIYGTKWLRKYPVWDEYIPNYEALAERNPFLNMVIAVTNSDQVHCCLCELIDYYSARRKENRAPKCIECARCKDGVCYAKLDKWFQKTVFELSRADWTDIDLTPYQYEVLKLTEATLTPINIANMIQLVIYVCDGKITILTGEKARELYIEYDNKYADPRMYIAQQTLFYGRNYSTKKRVHFNNAFMRECCAKLGNASLWNEVIVPRYMIPFQDEEVDVVTKEFLITEWDKAFGNTTMCYKNLIEYHKKYERHGRHRENNII